jgi:hypothetical protein
MYIHFEGSYGGLSYNDVYGEQMKLKILFYLKVNLKPNGPNIEYSY